MPESTTASPNTASPSTASPNTTSIIVASVPTSHAYIAHLDAVGGCGTVVRLPDPVPHGADGTGRWWPPRWLDAEWLATHIDGVDVFHLHFGFDAVTMDGLQDIVRILGTAGKPLILTVHDLHNPHFVDNTVHLAHLDVLVPAATEVITLTTGAAQEIAARWDRRATVLPHPHVAPLELIGLKRVVSSPFVVGVHMKGMRANLDPLAVVDTVIETVRALPDAVVRIDADDNAVGVKAALDRYRAVDGVDVRIHPRFDDEELWQYLSEIDVSVLPYRFGTHSGWLEACHDVGTAVIVPDCGHFSDQRPCYTFEFGIGRFAPSSLSSALRASYTGRFDPPAASREARELERNALASSHRQIYERALARTSFTAGSLR